MTILVTGGAGFIGSEMTRQLVRLGYNVLVMDSLTYAGKIESLAEVREAITFKRIDIRDKKALDEFFENHEVEVVINFAAETHVDNSIAGPLVFLETNVLGTFNLLEAARHFQFRFIQISTDEVYGSIEIGEFSENSILNPSSPYSASKASAELLMTSYVKTYNVDALAVRCSNNYGPYQHAEKLIPTLIRNAREGKKLPLYGSGKNVREWIHVADNVAAIIKVLEKGHTGNFYNISSGEFYSNLQVAEIVLDYFQKDRSSIDYVSDRPGHDFRYAIDSSKMRQELEWKPCITFAHGLRETISWYQENPEYLKAVI